MHDNWYQSSAYFLSSFALITTVSETGITTIGPYQLSFPFGVINRREWIVISRRGSNTSTHLKRVKKCAMNWVEYDHSKIKPIVDLGYPGQEPEDKMKDSPLKKLRLLLIEQTQIGQKSSRMHFKFVNVN